MNKKYIGLGCLGAFILVVLVLFFWIKGTYNGMVVARENGKEAFSQIDVIISRNFDELNRLDNELEFQVKASGKVLKDVIDARARATSITIDPSNCTPEQMKAWNQAQGDFTQALGRLMVADEEYPELQFNEAFQDVRDKISGAANRLGEARRKYNEQAKIYNVKIQTFPNTIFAGMFGFQQMYYYEAPAGTEQNTTDFKHDTEYKI